jgi:glycosyltransferase involved in cell wall biosynthesis
MKICIVGPGHTAIPPVGWGAVESLIWDYKQTLEKMGHNVLIINNPDHRSIIKLCDEFEPDFVHIQYDDHWPVCDNVKCENVAITSHYAYLEQPDKMGGYIHTFQNFLRIKKAKIFALSSRIFYMYANNGFDRSRIKIVPNGVREDLFRFDEACLYKDRSLYLAKIDYRKRQYLFQNIPNLYFAGNIADNRFSSERYLGEWTKTYLYDNLTNYANLVLLSDGEAHPLVCLEAMCAGLGLVISEWASANLDLDLPFIDVIPEFAVNDIKYVESVIEKNRLKSITMRQEIRDYAIQNFSWEKIVKNYYLPAVYGKYL